MNSNCKNCQNPLGSYFEVTRVDTKGNAKGSIRVCSIFCLIQWAYAYGVQRGVAGVVAAKGAFDRFMDVLKAVRG